MIKINPLSKELSNAYYNAVLPYYKIFIENISSNDSFTEFRKYIEYDETTKKYNEEKVKLILIGDKVQLDIIVDVVREIEDKPEAEKCYKEIHKNDLIKKWPKKIGVNACPYCNKIYVMLTEDDSRGTELDHFYPISKYPYLCVSMYNLIPTCHECNNAKKALNPKVDAFPYPYEDEYGYDIVFKVEPIIKDNILNENNNTDRYFDLKIVSVDGSPLPIKFEKENNRLKIEQQYKSLQLEINDQYKRINKYNEEYFKSLHNFLFLANDFDNFKKQILEVTSKEEWIKKPLLKLKHDIYKQYK